MSKLTKEVNDAFIRYFRKNKGVYSQEDVEKIADSNRQQLVKEIREAVEGMQNPYIDEFDEVRGISFGRHMAFEDARNDILALEVLQEGK